jgi:glycosyltransferase involved in cell wall biosynthesis
MSNIPSVSVVLPTYNSGNLLPRAIRSVLEQTLSDFELIVVNDGSTDDTIRIVNEIADRRISLINLAKNHGANYARNVGIASASAELIAFHDSDDEWLPTKLELQVSRLNSSDDPLATVVYVLVAFSHSVWWEDDTSNSTQTVHEGDVFLPLVKRYLCPITPQVMIKRSALISVGGFDITLPCYQDLDLFMRLAQTSNHFVAVNSPLVIKHKSDSCISSNVASKIRGTELFLCKWSQIVKLSCDKQIYRRWKAWFFLDQDKVKMSRAVTNGNTILALMFFIRSLRYLDRHIFWDRLHAFIVIFLKQDEQVYRNIHKYYQHKIKSNLSNLMKGQPL